MGSAVVVEATADSGGTSVDVVGTDSGIVDVVGTDSANVEVDSEDVEGGRSTLEVDVPPSSPQAGGTPTGPAS